MCRYKIEGYSKLLSQCFKNQTKLNLELFILHKGGFKIYKNQTNWLGFMQFHWSLGQWSISLGQFFDKKSKTIFTLNIKKKTSQKLKLLGVFNKIHKHLIIKYLALFIKHYALTYFLITAPKSFS
jgi:hypothetical protein